jgi:hypothetical protein
MKTRTLLIVLAVVAFAFVTTNCLAATVDANKPCDANKPADVNKPGKTTISAVDFSKYAEDGKEKDKGCDKHKDKDPNKGKGCDKDPNKATVISASDFGTLATKDVNKPADANKPAEPNKTKLSADGKGEKGKGCDKDKDANKPADPNCKK